MKTRKIKNEPKENLPEIRKNGNLPVSLDPVEMFREFLHLDVASGKASAKTVRNYMAGVRDYLTWLKTTEIKPTDATNATIKAYREYLIFRELKPSTIALKLVCVRRFYDALLECGKILINPAGKVKAPRDKTDRAENIKYLHEETVIELIRQINIKTDKGKRDKAIFVLCAIHGLRVSEIAGLKLDDIDLENRQIKVFGKGSKIRTVYLTETTAEILEKWLKISGSKGFVFTNFHHDQGIRGTLSTRGIEKIIDRYLELVGAKRAGISCHSLRHTSATLALSKGASLESIRDNLGHSSVKTTEIYAKVLEREKNNPAKFLDALLK